MLDQLLQRIPKLLLGFVVIVGVLLFLLYTDPPKTLCDIQMEGVNERLRANFYADANRGKYNNSIKEALNLCLESNSPGGCYDLFTRYNYFEKQVRTIPTECGPHGSVVPIQDGLQRGIKILVEIAWGGKPPESVYDKKAWLDSTDLGLYCRLKQQYIRLAGKEKWALFREALMNSLPGADKIDRKQRWEKSLFSFPCKGYY
ncbi:MAG: hypothetical protein KDD33_10575 [Bdellovibrionales bacterium]|nr:hypothetical protein [Bdellovibrionales bacterium]